MSTGHIRFTTLPTPIARIARVAWLAAVPVALASAGAQVSDGNGFLIGTPSGSLAIRGGWALAAAHSDLFSFTTQQLTLDRGDFSSPVADIDLAFRVTPRTDLVVSTTVAGTRKKSEFRHFIDNNDKPIEQQTSFYRVPMTMSVKHYLTDRGRSIGRLAWVPTRIAPYLGAGGGIMWYRFRQQGDFIDFETNDVFHSILESSGWTQTVHALGGADFTINPRLALVTETRYGWAKGKLDADFSGFQRIDLSGFSTTAGLSVRF